MQRNFLSQNRPDVHHIQIKLNDIGQLFNTMDPSPFLEKDLDADAEEFIISWAREFPFRDDLILTIHLAQPKGAGESDELIEKAVQNYFSYRACLARMEFHRLLREGRLSLLIGLVFLILCLTASELLREHTGQTFSSISSESLTIAGWVAMWRPFQIYLYDWWPLRIRWRVFEKLGRMKVEVVRAG